MQVVSSVAALRQDIDQYRQAGKKVAFVPTMGNLHDGHLQLVKLARQKADVVVTSIFVNPMQFGQGEDYDSYPRTHEADIERLTAVHNDLLFLPEVDTMYPIPIEQQTMVEVPGLSNILCGASRPGHFTGVATVVCKLFNLVQPDLAIFGEKDFQQLMIIRQMVRDLCLPIEIIGAPIVREADGLAMSSRNGYLDQQQRKLAPSLHRQLQHMQQQLIDGNRDFAGLEKHAEQQLNAAGFLTDYIQIRRSTDLQKPAETDNDLIILAAAFLGSTRLIDNLLVTQ